MESDNLSYSDIEIDDYVASPPLPASPQEEGRESQEEIVAADLEKSDGDMEVSRFLPIAAIFSLTAFIFYRVFRTNLMMDVYSKWLHHP